MTNYKLLTAIVLSLFVATLSAQTYEDILRYSQPQYSGTARSMAMGSAFGSLGGDFSAIGINPAGIAVYRSSEFSFTPSLSLNSTKSDFNQNSTIDNKTSFILNQIGYVGTYRPMREVKKGIVSTHFAIGYNRNNNFNYKSMALSPESDFSLTDVFRDDAYGYARDILANHSDLTALAYNAYILGYEGQDSENKEVYTAYLSPENKVNQIRSLDKDGNSSEINISGGFNISNILLVGASLNFASLRYKENFDYIEEFSPNNGTPLYDVFNHYTINNHLDVSGSGINLKLGIILKPTNQLRVGIAYHTPTWYDVEEKYGVNIDATFFNSIDGSNNTYANTKGNFDYKMSTPDKVVGSISYILGKIAILSFDYERVSYSKAKFKATQNEDIIFFNDQNKQIKSNLKNTNNYRAGVEVRINPSFSLRGGYSFQPSAYKQASKYYEYQNISGGFGYRNKNYFIDIAYQLSKYDSDHVWYPDVNAQFDPPAEYAKVKTTNHSASLTVGWKF